MSRWSEREIARKLAERDELEPPPGLLEKIKSEIPPMIPAGTGVPEIDRRPSMPPRQRWLIAASLVAMVGAGLFALRVGMEVPPVGETARTAVGARQPEPRRVTPTPPPAAPPQRSLAQPLVQPSEAPAPKPLSRKDEERLKSLGYAGSVEGSLQGGSAGGALAGEPRTTPAAPPAAAAPAPPAAMPEAQAPAEKKEAAAEAPLLDERRAERDRINVGGNEAGQQSLYKGPGTAGRLRSAPASRAKTAGAEPLWQVPSAQVTLETDADTFSYDLARRSIAAGKLPDPAVVRIGQIVNAFEAGDAPPAEGASTPFVHGPQYRLLRIHPGGAGPAQVTFNPLVVVRYRSIGTGVSALYEIELRPDVSPQDALMAVLHQGNQGKAVTAGDLASSWSQASPGFRLAALAAEFAEILKGSPVDSSALHRLSAEIGKLPKSAKAAELAELVEKAGRIEQRR
ncbi:MAG TPA: von Willebrand factor type A domain-containing protein [Thermoanaerobaculia bacterium]|jgi:hypothetical protein